MLDLLSRKYLALNRSVTQITHSFFVQSHQGRATMEMRVPSAVLEVRHVPATQPSPAGIALSFSPQLQVHYDRDTRALWSRWSPEPRPCFNPALLADIRAYYEFLGASNARIDCLGEEHDIEYVVLASGKPGVFNLGGDLDLFKQLIAARDRQGLLRYGRACI